MDPARCELFVEGSRDRRFLMWLIGDQLKTNAMIREIAFVHSDTPVLGGERGRLFEFARFLEDKPVRIQCFADADTDRILKRPIPSRVWLTDGRDLEAYVLSIHCIDKVLRVGICVDGVSAEELMRAVTREGRLLGVLRLMSELDGLKLPFQKTKLANYVEWKNDQLVVGISEYLRALLQNAGISLAKHADLLDRLAELNQKYNATPSFDLLHGKDAFCLLHKALAKYKIGEEAFGRMLWMSFESRHIARESNLSKVVDFLTT